MTIWNGWQWKKACGWYGKCRPAPFFAATKFIEKTIFLSWKLRIKWVEGFGTFGWMFNVKMWRESTSWFGFCIFMFLCLCSILLTIRVDIFVARTPIEGFEAHGLTAITMWNELCKGKNGGLLEENVLNINCCLNAKFKLGVKTANDLLVVLHSFFLSTKGLINMIAINFNGS